MIQYQVDEMDRKIIDKLTNDARASNRHLAQSLGVTEGTVRGRIKRLEAANLIRFQQAYQASSRVIQVAQDMFKNLLELR